MGAQILLDLGVKDMILLTDTPEKKVVALEGYGLNIVGTHPDPRRDKDEVMTADILIVEARFYPDISRRAARRRDGGARLAGAQFEPHHGAGRAGDSAGDRIRARRAWRQAL